MRKANPVIVWRSVQWQIITILGVDLHLVTDEATAAGPANLMAPSVDIR